MTEREREGVHIGTRALRMATSTPGGVVIDLTSLGLGNEAVSVADSTAQKRVRRLFHLPVVFDTGADGDESSFLLDESKKRPPRNCNQCDTVAKISWAVCPIVTTLLMAAILGVVVVVFQKLESGIKTIDASVDLTSTASSMLANMNSMLASSASLAHSADKLGLKAINLTYILGPFTSKAMNKTEHILEQVDRLTNHPTFSLG